MTYVAVAQLVVIVLLVGVLYVRERQHDAAVRWMVETEARERDVLLQRVQAPERTPVLPQHLRQPADPQVVERQREVSEEHRKGLATVGTVPPMPE